MIIHSFPGGEQLREAGDRGHRARGMDRQSEGGRKKRTNADDGEGDAG